MSELLDKKTEIQAACFRQPGFTSGTAYVRSKLCCAILLERGEPIPSWMVIRELIGKGSSGDITRGIKDFRQEHAARLRQMSGISPGMPPQLAPAITALWEAALVAAHAEFVQKSMALEAQALQADNRAEQAENDLLAARSRIVQFEAAAQAVQAELRSLSAQLETERGAKAQAEQMFHSTIAEINAQREKLESALRETKTETARALERFDGERKFALQQIEEARAKAAAEVASIRAASRRECDTMEIEKARLSATIAAQASELAAAKQRVLDMQAALDAMKVDLATAQAVADKLKAADRPRSIYQQRRNTDRARLPSTARRKTV